MTSGKPPKLFGGFFKKKFLDKEKNVFHTQEGIDKEGSRMTSGFHTSWYAYDEIKPKVKPHTLKIINNTTTKESKYIFR